MILRFQPHYINDSHRNKKQTNKQNKTKNNSKKQQQKQNKKTQVDAPPYKLRGGT